MITYAPFWETLKREKLTTYELIKYDGISSSTIHRLRQDGACRSRNRVADTMSATQSDRWHNLPVGTKTLDKLCKALDCYSIFDVIEYKRD